MSNDVLLPSQINEMFGDRNGIQLVDRLVKLGVCSKEYKVDDSWLKEPAGRVTAVRYDVSAIRASLQDVAEMLKYLKYQAIQAPVYAEKIRERLLLSRTNDNELIVFSPWGPKYSGEMDLIPETKTLEEVRERLKFAQNKLKTRYLLMPADLYGTEINRLSESAVKGYFERLSQLTYQILGETTSVSIKPWSEIRSENYSRYEELLRKFTAEFDSQVGEDEYRKAIRISKIFGSENPAESARRYCLERLIEAVLIDELFSPVKLSLVKKEKDILDGPLPRIYIISNRAPWLK